MPTVRSMGPGLHLVRPRELWWLSPLYRSTDHRLQKPRARSRLHVERVAGPGLKYRSLDSRRSFAFITRPNRSLLNRPWEHWKVRVLRALWSVTQGMSDVVAG